jgi:hypothetical protein
MRSSSSSRASFTFDDSVNITLYNFRNLYLLFKPDVISSLVSFNPYYFKSSSSTHSSSSNKPNGISIKQKLSECTEERNMNNNFVTSTNNCFSIRDFLEKTTSESLNESFSINCTGSDQNSTFCLSRNLAETVEVYGEDDEITLNDLNSTIRRAMHCSFTYKNFMYVLGGYSYSTQVSFVSRLNLVTLRWEHKLDRKVSTVVNRSNRRLFSNINFKQPKMDVPQNRYAHSCALDTNNVRKL